MKAKHAVLSLLLIVVIFVSKGFHANYVVQRDMDNVSKEFEVATNTLSPLFDSYSIGIVDSQVKVSHGLINGHEFCDRIEKAVAEQQKRLREYADIVKGNETADDKELFARSKELYAYANKMVTLCKKNDIVAIHQSLYSGEMYKIVDPITDTINRLLDAKFAKSESYKKDAFKAIKHHDDVMIFASILTGILGVAILKHKDKPTKKVDKKKKKTRVARK